MTATPAATRAATLARLREHPGFAEVWGWYESWNVYEGTPAPVTVERLITMAHAIGMRDGLDQAAAILGKPREVA